MVMMVLLLAAVVIITSPVILLGAVAATTTTAFVGVNKRRVLFLHGKSTGLSSSSTDNGESSSTRKKPTNDFATLQRKKEVMLLSNISNVSCMPLVVCGPSGVGKGTIISRFIESLSLSSNTSTQQQELPEFVFSVSHTTRQPRPGEINGMHYHFINMTYMKELIASQSYFVEHAEVHGNLYGTSFESMLIPLPTTDGIDDDAGGGGLIQRQQRQCLLDIDVAGVKSIKNFQLKQRLLLQQRQQQQQHQQSIKLGKEKSTSQYNNLHQGITNDYDTSQFSSFFKNNSNTIVMTKEEEYMLLQYPLLNAKFIFITPPSIDTLYTRLLNRNTETSTSLKRRIQNAQSEIDYGLMDNNFHAIIVNDNLDVACDEFRLAVEKLYS